MAVSDHSALSWLQHWSVRYIGALLAASIALAIWWSWSVMHQDPFAVFIAAVIVSARLFGFGPALLCTIASAFALDYFAFDLRHLGFDLSASVWERLLIFVLISLVTAGLARKRSQAEMRVSEMSQRMAAIVESSEDAIFSSNTAGIISSWNRGAETLYGYSAEEAVGRHVSILAPRERMHEISINLDRLNRGDSVPAFQTERVRRDGTRVHVLISISPMRGRAGEIVGNSAIIRDITAQKRAEDALRRNEKLATAGRLAATIAHEINNPLEAVGNLLYLARHDATQSNDYLIRAERELQRVASLAQQTLGFVRDTTSVSPLNVSETLDQVVRLYAPKLHSRRIETEVRFDNQARIEGFQGELRQLFSNLIINAMDAMPAGGTLSLRVSRTHEWKDGKRPGVRVLVADTGVGIGQDDLNRIFEPFFTTGKDSGTGLGLWLAHGIVQKHGGSIRVRSRTGGGQSGTAFSVFFPTVARSRQAA
jgi:two-component system CheB/CheR fusion protein